VGQNVLTPSRSNATVVTTYIDPSGKKVTQVTATAQSALNATNITINGLLQWESTTTVASPTRHYYDALGRETSVTSPLGFSRSQTYNSSGQVASKSDFTGAWVAYEYYPNGVTGAGQLKTETRSNGRKTFHKMWQPTAWLRPPAFRTMPEQLHVTSRPAPIGGTAFTYHSERFNGRATHIHRCPREPREVQRTSGPWFPPAKRVRSATASSDFESMIASSTVLCQGRGQPPEE